MFKIKFWAYIEGLGGQMTSNNLYVGVLVTFMATIDLCTSDFENKGNTGGPGGVLRVVRYNKPPEFEKSMR